MMKSPVMLAHLLLSGISYVLKNTIWLILMWYTMKTKESCHLSRADPLSLVSPTTPLLFMNTIIDLFKFIVQCISDLRVASPQSFYFSLTGGTLAAAAIYFLASRFSHLWNTRFNLRPGHHVLCSLAALATLFVVVAWVGLGQAAVVAGRMIDVWTLRIQNDQKWGSDTFDRAYYTIRDLKVEDFSNHPAPENGGTIVPLNHPSSKLEWASAYANGALDHFQNTQSFLALFLWANAKLPRSLVEEDENAWFAAGNKIYPSWKAVQLVSTETQRQLKKNVEHLVAYGRGGLAILFGFFQTLAFGLIAYASYSDLKAWHRAGRNMA